MVCKVAIDLGAKLSNKVDVQDQDLSQKAF